MGKPITLILFLALSTQQLLGQAVPYGYNEEAGHYFDAGGDTSLYYEVYGEGPPLLLLHGGVFGYIDEFKNLIPKLAGRYQVIALATRGHVKSDVGTEPYTYEQRATDALELIQHLKLDKVTVIGFSDGGFAGYKLAAMHPDVVEKLVAMGAGDDPPSETPGTSSYSAEKLMAEYGDHFEKRVAHMPEPERWGRVSRCSMSSTTRARSARRRSGRSSVLSWSWPATEMNTRTQPRISERTSTCRTRACRSFPDAAT